MSVSKVLSKRIFIVKGGFLNVFSCKMATKRYRQVFAGVVSDFIKATEKLSLEFLNNKAMKILKNTTAHIKK
jgi:hypothetical protein